MKLRRHKPHHLLKKEGTRLLPNPQANITDWNGPDDAGNPQNWGSAKKVYATMIPALYAFTV